MSSFLERARARAPRRRILVSLALLVVAVAALSARGGWSSAADVLTPVKVAREDLVLTVDVDGELASVRSTDIGAPPVTEVEFKIAFLAPEGAAVKTGQPILGFDTEALNRLLVDKKAELAEFT